MPSYSRSHLADDALLRGFARHADDERGSLAEVLADIVEVEKRKLYLPAGYPSMLAYCTDERRFTRDAARRRINAAHVAAKFPAIFPAVAEGRLDLSAVLALARHLTPANADELLSAAAYKSRFEIEQLMAAWAPKLDVPTQVEAVAAPANSAPSQGAPSALLTEACAPARTISPAERTKLEPLAPGKVALHMTMTQEMYDDLCYAQALDSHAVPSGDPAQVLARALKEHIRGLERRRFAPSARSRRGTSRDSKNPRHIPMNVRREVWLRDGGQCAFVSTSGKRCPARTGWSSITWTRSLAGATRRSQACRRRIASGSAAGRTTSSPPSRCTERGSCGRSGRKTGDRPPSRTRVAPPKRPGGR